MKRAAGYVLLCAVPLLLAVVGPLPPARSVTVEFGVMLGFVALGMLALQFLLTARFSDLSTRVGQDLLLQFHRAAGIVAALLVLAHAALLLAAEPTYREFLDPRVNAPRTLALTSATAAIVILILSSLARRRMGIPYEWWRLAHGAMAAFILLVAGAHVFMVGQYAASLWKGVLFVLFAGAPIVLLLWIRLVQPMLKASKAIWLVESVQPEAPGVWTVTLAPKESQTLNFVPGQFAWFAFGSSPLTFDRHPFTIASSARRPQRLSITIKALGDFTGRIGELPVGTHVHIEGPAGGMTVPSSARRLLLIAGGIGITPMMSILRTMADDGDERPVTLLHGIRTMDDAIFSGELAELEARPNIRVVHVPETAPPGWDGPSGRIDADLLAAHLGSIQDLFVLVCGPAPMMAIVEDVMLRSGVRRSSLRAEHFDVV